MARLKFGFHLGAGGGNANGIGTYLHALDAAGIPFVIKCSDSMAGVFDGQVIAQSSHVPHVLLYRTSTRTKHGGYDYDLPDYNLTPKEAARRHWEQHRAVIPPELDRSLVWVEAINEPRKEVEWADWLGHCATELAMLMNNEGYKFAAFGYSSGTPELGAWDTGGMKRYLEYCALHPGEACVSLHEYSWRTDNIWNDRGFLIGRFEHLFDACDRHGIMRPEVIISEWGWAYDDVPSPSVAMQHILEVGELYARYPELLGAAIWYLGPEYQGIANKAQKLIQPVTELTLETVFPDVEEPPKEDDVMDELQKAIWEASLNLQNQRGINWNPAFGFPTAIRNAGYWPATNETTLLIGGVQYVIMVAEHPQKQQPRKVFAYKHPWGSGPVIEIVDPKV